MKLDRRTIIVVAAFALVLVAALVFLRADNVAQMMSPELESVDEPGSPTRLAARAGVAPGGARPLQPGAAGGSSQPSTAGSGASEECQSCRQRECSNYAGLGMDVVDGCTQSVNEKWADKTDPTFIEDCTSFVRCAKQNHCAESPIGAAGCYCGSRNLDDCIAEGPGPDAPCIAQIQRATRATTNQDLVVRFSDMSYPSGWANYMLQCDQLRCTGKCNRGGG